MRMRERMELRIAPMMALAAMGMLIWDQSGLVAVTLVAAFVHECGHLLAGRLLGVGFSGLRIGLSGVRLDVRGRMLSYGEEWTLAAAGPLFSLLAAGAASPLWARFSEAQLFSCASLLLGVLNLLPIRTFDGGRMTECLLAQLMGFYGDLSHPKHRAVVHQAVANGYPAVIIHNLLRRNAPVKGAEMVVIVEPHRRRRIRATVTQIADRVNSPRIIRKLLREAERGRR